MILRVTHSIDNEPAATYLHDFIEAAQLAEAKREEKFIRENAWPLIRRGYRLDELVIKRFRKHMHPSEDPLVLDIAKPLTDMELAARRAWRRIFPYRIPKGSIQ